MTGPHTKYVRFGGRVLFLSGLKKTKGVLFPDMSFANSDMGNYPQKCKSDYSDTSPKTDLN
jgi:hypothetical protein